LIFWLIRFIFVYYQLNSINETIPRRKFIQSTALAGGALLFFPALNGCKSVAASGNYFQDQFGIDDALCQRLLAKALSRGGDFADLYFEYTVSNSLGLEDGKVTQSSGSISLGVGIRTVKGDQTGYGFTQDLTEESMIAAA
jgi:TldD protein